MSEYVTSANARSLREIPERLRPRELVQRVGIRNAPDDVLLAIILRSGVKGVNVAELARNLLREYGSLTGIASASVDELAAIQGMGKVKAQVLKAAMEIAVRLAEEAEPSKISVKTPADVACLLREHVRGLEAEVFWVLLLDAKNHLKRAPVDITRGLLDANLVHPREVFREAVRSSTAAIVVAHNHPSGDPTPSAEDIRITRQLVDAGKVMDIRILDHVIMGKKGDGGEFVSLREEGVIDFS